MYYCLLVLYIFITLIGANLNEFLDVKIGPTGSAFRLDQSVDTTVENQFLLATSSNSDRYQLQVSLGSIRNSLQFSGSNEIEEDPVHVTVHLFNNEIEENSKTAHFLCHASLGDSIIIQKPHDSFCCFITVNTTFSQEFASCVLTFDKLSNITICHTSVRLPSVLWKQKSSPVITISYATFNYRPDDHSFTKGVHSDEKCSLHAGYSGIKFAYLPPASVVKSVPDAIREIGRSLLIQIPRRELRINEEFIVPIRLKHGDDVSDFTIRCEVPANSFVEFVRVIWPGSLTNTKPRVANAAVADSASDDVKNTDENSPSSGGVSPTHGRPDIGLRNVWDIFHRSIVSQKRNITEIVARFREDLIRTNQAEKHSSATEVYKLLFRVNRPPNGSSGRVAPRMFWSLVSLSRRDTPDRTVGGSPIVTRLNIESSELKHLAMVIKSSALVNLAALTGRPSVHPVWIYGLTHDSHIIDVSHRATCHTGDDAVIHFADDSCTRLGFSGAELDGSPGLPLVAKLDGRSATATLLVWFPKHPALRLVVGRPSVGGGGGGDRSTDSPSVQLKRISSQPGTMGSEWSVREINVTQSAACFQHQSVRILARFILAGSVLYDKDVLGGKIGQHVDVTAYTAHRLRLEEVTLSDGQLNGVHAAQGGFINHTTASVKLVMLPSQTAGNRETATLSGVESNELVDSVWIVGQSAGRARLQLDPIDWSLVRTRIPPGLVKQLNDPVVHANRSHADETQGGFIHKRRRPTLEISVSETASIWPVGLSAQIVTDFTLSLSQSVDSPVSATESLHPLASRGRVDTSDQHKRPLSPYPTDDNEPPLLSGLYAVHADLIGGGPLAHSGQVPSTFPPPPSRSDASSHRQQQWQRLTNWSRDDGTMSSERGQEGFVIVWIHLSDGSMVLWHRMLEVCRAAQKPLPFQLVIENLSPDRFKITNQTPHSLEPLQRQRRRRSARLNGSPFSNWGRKPLRADPWSSRRIPLFSAQRSSPWLRQDLEYNDADQEIIDADGTTNIAWQGPKVRAVRGGLPYSGELLQLQLQSPSGQPLLPKLRLSVTMPTSASIDDVRQQESNIKSVPEQPAPVYRRPSTSTQFEQYPRLPYQSGLPDETTLKSKVKPSIGSHGLLALKDAPGFRGSHPSVISSTRPDKTIPSSKWFSRIDQGRDASDDTSLSDQHEESPSIAARIPETKQELDGVIRDKLETSESTTSSRPALEMSMYVLLGLFALVGLVFAVNCGAVVARYRWERVTQRRSSEQQGMTNTIDLLVGSRMADQQASGCADEKRDITSEQNKPMLMDPDSKGAGASARPRLMDKYRKLFLPGRSKHKPLLHRDNNWVWISREKAAAAFTSGPTDPATASMHSSGPLHVSGAGTLRVHRSPDRRDGANHSLARSQSHGARQMGTTAVLSIAEADMLLLHSPYHRQAWAGGSRQSGDERDDSIHGTPQRAPRYNDSDTNLGCQPWAAMDEAIDEDGPSFTRPTRRHTTSCLTQRNYQGQECSIRIISNPIPNETRRDNATSIFDGTSTSSSQNPTTRDPQRQNSCGTNTHLIGLDRQWTTEASHHGHPTQPGSTSASMQRRNRWDPQTYAIQQHRAHMGKPMDWLAPNPHGMPYPCTAAGPPGPLAGTDMYWEAVMYRSWVRQTAKPFNEQLDRAAPVQQNNASETAQLSHGSPWQYRQQTTTPVTNQSTQGQSRRREHPVNRMDGRSEDGEEDTGHDAWSQLALQDPDPSAPFPPMRTTSRVDAYHTLESHKAERKAHSAPGHRPMSLPQSFQATNELYSLLTPSNKAIQSSGLMVVNQDGTDRLMMTRERRVSQPDQDTEEGEVLESGTGGVDSGAAQLRTSSPSEESLWWYHPIRQQQQQQHNRRRKHRSNGAHSSLQRAVVSGPLGMAVQQRQHNGLNNTPRVMSMGAARDDALAMTATAEYACPTTSSNQRVEQPMFALMEIMGSE